MIAELEKIYNDHYYFGWHFDKCNKLSFYSSYDFKLKIITIQHHLRIDNNYICVSIGNFYGK